MRDPAEVHWGEPIFVVSAGRSGSTHLTNILNADWRIAIAFETKLAHYFRAGIGLATTPIGERFAEGPVALRGVVGGDHIPRFAELYGDHARAMLQEFHCRLFGDKPFVYWGDKFQWPEVIPDLRVEFPGARFIAIVRDGRDQVVSSTYWAAREEAMRPYLPPADFADRCRLWARLNWTLLRLLQGHEKLLQVRYEDLVRSPTTVIDEIFGFLGIRPSPGVIDYVAQGDPGFFAYHGTSASPVASLGRWHREMTDDQKAIAHELMGPVLDQLGYATDG